MEKRRKAFGDRLRTYLRPAPAAQPDGNGPAPSSLRDDPEDGADDGREAAETSMPSERSLRRRATAA